MLPSKNYNKRRFKPAEFEAADRLERLYMHRLDPANCKLAERELRHYDRVRHAMLMLIKPTAIPSEVVWLLTQDLGIKTTTARTLVAQVPVVYPDLTENARILEKEDIVAMLHTVVQHCRESNESEDKAILIKAAKEIREIRQWGKEDFGIKKGDIQIPIPIWSDDPSVLEVAKDEPEEAEYEEIDNDMSSDFNPENYADYDY
jgi:hypothetical protein